MVGVRCVLHVTVSDRWTNRLSHCPGWVANDAFFNIGATVCSGLIRKPDRADLMVLVIEPVRL